MASDLEIFTLGHSTLSLEAFLALVHTHALAHVVDVRRFPGSRRHPHFAGPALAAALAEQGVGYTWLPGLGGRRSRRADSPHTGWRVAAFAGYADHMDTPEFRQAAAQLLELPGRARTAILCAEALPQRCHRRLVADWLLAHGVRVTHILTKSRACAHALTPFARVEGGRVIYDGGQPDLPTSPGRR
jgi:uncharacterized protein (DUF488 family)